MEKEIKAVIWNWQNYSNIGLDERDQFLNEVVPRDVKQAKVIEYLKDLLKKEYRTLVLCGTEGSGKTYLSCAALNTEIWRCYMQNLDMERGPMYITQKELDMRFRSAMNETGNSELKVFNTFANYSLLIIDEIGRSGNSKYSMDNIELLISKRYSFHRPTIIITNETADELKQMFDRHILDRLAKKGATFELDTESQR